MTAVDRAPRPTSQWRPATSHLLGVQVVFSLAILAGVTVLAALVVLIVHLAGTPGQSFLQYGLQIQVWFAFGLTIWTVWAGMDHLVPAGATRRAVLVAVPTAAAAGALLAGVLSTVTVWLEGAVYDLAGWAHVASSDEGVVEPGPWAQGWFEMAFERSALLVAGALAGMLVGAAFYRFSSELWLVGVLTLPFTLLPMLLVGLVVADGTVTFGPTPELPGWAYGSPALAAVLALVMVYSLALAWVLLRDVGLRMRPL